MDFTKEDFLALWRTILKVGMSIDLDAYECFGYFEINVYADKHPIRYNIYKVKRTKNNIIMRGVVSVGNFTIGKFKMRQFEFMRYAKNISLLGNYPQEWKVNRTD